MSSDIQAFDFSVDLLKALLWEYNDAVTLQSLLREKAAWYEINQTEFWKNWITDVFDLRTANDFGLNVWSIILGQSIYINSTAQSRVSWGFGQYHVNFNRGNFAGGGTQQLPTESARLLLRLRYFQLTSAGTVPEVNRMLAYLFAELGTAYLTDNHNMTQTYIFEFTPSSNIQFVLNNFDILPRPAGVASSITYP